MTIEEKCVAQFTFSTHSFISWTLWLELIALETRIFSFFTENCFLSQTTDEA